MSNSKKIGVYIHSKPDGTPFYVGKGTEGRSRMMRKRGEHHSNIVNKYGLEKIHICFIECENESLAFEHEIELIKYFRKKGFKLLNKSDGGEGPGMNHEVTSETRKKISKSLTNRKFTDEWKQKISKSLTGKKLSDETKEKLRQISTGKYHTEESKQKMSNKMKGRKLSQETKDKIRLALKGRKHPPEWKEKWSETQKKLWSNPDHRQKVIKGHYKNKPIKEEDDA